MHRLVQPCGGELTCIIGSLMESNKLALRWWATACLSSARPICHMQLHAHWCVGCDERLPQQLTHSHIQRP